MSLIRGITSVVLISAALLLGAFAILQPLKERLVAANHSVQTLGQEIAQLQERVVLLQAKTAADTNQDIGAFQLTAADLLDAEIMLQSRVLDTLARFEIAPISFAPTLPAIEATKATVGFEVEFETSYANALEVLALLETHKPYLAFEDLWIRGVPASSRPEEVSPVYVRLLIWGFWGSQSEEEG